MPKLTAGTDEGMRTKVYDRNGDPVPRVLWIDTDTHEVCIHVEDPEEPGRFLVKDGELVSRIYEVEGWTYRTDGAEPQPI